MKKITIQLVIFVFVFLFTQGIKAQVITTVAGNDSLGAGYSGDGGKATLAKLNGPFGLAIDTKGNLYIADQSNSLIRKVDATGKISTFAGDYTYGAGYYGDGGPATLAEMDNPYGIAFDKKGNLYIADGWNNIIRKVSTTGVITTVAGNYSLGYGYNGDGGAATSAQLNQPTSVAFDTSGNMYIADMGNNVVRIVSPGGIINTYAGNNSLGGGYSGDGGAAVFAQFYFPYGVACDKMGNLYVADIDNHVVRKVNSAGVITTVAGNHTKGFGYSGDGGIATSAQLNYPVAVAADSIGDIFISDQSNNVIRMVNTSGTISTVAGDFAAGAGYSGDGGPPTAAQLSHPASILYIANNLYIADQNNNVIRKLTGVVGINELKVNSEKFKVFPNPSAGIVNFVIANGVKPSHLEIYNVMGEKIQSFNIQNLTFSINLLSQPAGIYLYRIIANDGSCIASGNIILR